jgi:hypothetical protein
VLGYFGGPGAAGEVSAVKFLFIDVHFLKAGPLNRESAADELGPVNAILGSHEPCFVWSKLGVIVKGEGASGHKRIVGLHMEHFERWICFEGQELVG